MQKHSKYSDNKLFKGDVPLRACKHRLFSAFTLSELLIALAVIGILSAVLMPIIQHIIPNQNTLVTKRAYYAVNKTVDEMINDTECYPVKVPGTDVKQGFEDGFGYTNCIWGSSVAPESLTTEGDPAQKFRTLFFSYLEIDDADASSSDFQVSKDGIGYSIKTDSNEESNTVFDESKCTSTLTDAINSKTFSASAECPSSCTTTIPASSYVDQNCKNETYVDSTCKTDCMNETYVDSTCKTNCMKETYLVSSCMTSCKNYTYVDSTCKTNCMKETETYTTTSTTTELNQSCYRFCTSDNIGCANTLCQLSGFVAGSSAYSDCINKGASSPGCNQYRTNVCQVNCTVSKTVTTTQSRRKYTDDQCTANCTKNNTASTCTLACTANKTDSMCTPGCTKNKTDSMCTPGCTKNKTDSMCTKENPASSSTDQDCCEREAENNINQQKEEAKSKALSCCSASNSDPLSCCSNASGVSSECSSAVKGAYTTTVGQLNLIILVDIDGPTMGNNCTAKTCATGKKPDRFEIFVNNDGGITINQDDSWAVEAIKVGKEITN